VSFPIIHLANLDQAHEFNLGGATFARDAPLRRQRI